MRIERNMTTAMSEVQKETKDETARTLDALLFLFTSLTASGTVVDAVKVIVTNRPATTEHALHVLVSHLPPILTRSLCFSVKTSSGVWPFLLRRGRPELLCFEFFIYCIPRKKNDVVIPLPHLSLCTETKPKHATKYKQQTKEIVCIIFLVLFYRPS